MFNSHHIRLLFLALLLSNSQEQLAHPAVAIAAVKVTAAATKAAAAKGSLVGVVKAAFAKFGVSGATKAVWTKAATAVATKGVAAAGTTTATTVTTKASVVVAAKTTAAVATKVSAAAVAKTSVAAAVEATATVAAKIAGTAAVKTSALAMAVKGLATSPTTNQSPSQPEQHDKQSPFTREQLQKAFDEKVDQLLEFLKADCITIVRGVLIEKIISNAFNYFTGEKARVQNETKQLREQEAQKQQQAEELVAEIRKIHDVLISMNKG
jgi:hypothetical protein